MCRRSEETARGRCRHVSLYLSLRKCTVEDRHLPRRFGTSSTPTFIESIPTSHLVGLSMHRPRSEHKDDDVTLVVRPGPGSPRCMSVDDRSGGRWTGSHPRLAVLAYPQAPGDPLPAVAAVAAMAAVVASVVLGVAAAGDLAAPQRSCRRDDVCIGGGVCRRRLINSCHSDAVFFCCLPRHDSMTIVVWPRKQHR